MTPKSNSIKMFFAALGVTVLVCPVLAADPVTGPPVKRLATISMPAGDSSEAQAAARLLPVSVSGYSLLKPESFTELDQSDTDTDTDTDSGIETDSAPTTDGDTAALSEKSIAEQAREAALAFNLVAAAELWRRAADNALKSEEMLLSPRRTAQLLLEAGAAAVAAGEQDLALVYFRKSIAVDSAVLPGPEISPDAKDVYRQAVVAGPLLPDVPREAVLERVCETLQVDGVLWTAVGVDNGEWVVLFKRFIKGNAVGEVETKRFAGPLSETEIKTEQSRFKRIAEGMNAAPPTRTADTVKPPVVAQGKPWYKKWWFYTAVGAVLIVGGGIGVGVWAAKQPETVDATLHY